MINSTATGFVLLISLLLPLSKSGATSLADTIKQLGTEGSDIKRIQSLTSDPAKSVELLIAELHPIEAVRVAANERNPEAEHVLWAIRALRFLTGGKDFCSETSHRFGATEVEKNRKYWLMFKERRCLPFFATWPSRGSDYIAPHDSQIKIIDQWKQWFEREGKAFDYKPLVNPQPRDWLW